MLGTTVLVCIVAICVGRSNGDDVYQRYVNETLAQKCPYLSTCSRLASEQFPSNLTDYVPCCLPCSCDDSCLELGNCCNDANILTKGKPADTVCTAAAYSQKSIISNGYSSLYKRYRAIVSCPKDYNDKTVKRACKTNTFTTFDDLLLVSDEKETIYRNIYCAKCNGVDNIIKWELQIICPGSALKESFDVDFASFYEKKCVFISAPPKSTFSSKTCLTPDVSYCPLNILQESTNALTVTACFREKGLFLTQTTVYKNVFCYLCSKPLIVNDMCLKQTTERTPTFSFLLVIDLDTHVNSKLQDHTHPCEKGEIYDKYFSRCRQLICPYDTVASNGHCIQKYRMAKHVPIRISARVHTSSPLYQEDVVQLKDQLINIFSSQGCIFCSFRLRLASVISNLTWVVELEIMTSQFCSIPDIVQTVNGMAQKTDVVIINEKEVHYNVKLLEESFEPLDGDLSFRTRDSLCAGMGVSLNLFKCPRVKVTSREYVELRQQEVIKNAVSETAVRDNKSDEYEICLDNLIWYNKSSSFQINSCIILLFVMVTIWMYQHTYI